MKLRDTNVDITDVKMSMNPFVETADELQPLSVAKLFRAIVDKVISLGHSLKILL